MADLGNVLRHAHDQVIDEQIWAIIEQDLGPLQHSIEIMAERLHNERTDQG